MKFAIYSRKVNRDKLQRALNEVLEDGKLYSSAEEFACDLHNRLVSGKFNFDKGDGKISFDKILSPPPFE